MDKKFGYKYFSNKQKKSILKKLSFINGLMLIMQISFGSLFFIAPISETQASDGKMCEQPVDVVLIIDRSGSMEYTSRCDWWQLKCNNPPSCSTGYTWTKNITYNQTESWCNSKNQSAPHQSVYLAIDPKKIVAAKDAADNFVSLMGLNDQSSLVSYASTATLDKGLSNNHASTQTAINSLVTGGATNIGDAIKLGTQELRSSRANSQANHAMILLTDGKANKPNGPGYDEFAADVTYAQNKAVEAASYGFKIFTIGLGDNGEINEAMLQNIANVTGADYYHSPTQNDLQAIYDSIAWRLCQYGSISGCKYSDADNDGVIGGHEKISGWEITLNNDDNFTQLTDDTGCYLFSGLLPGNYTITEGGKAGVVSEQTYPASGSHVINLAEGEDLENIDFGNYVPICGNTILDVTYGEVCEIGNTNLCYNQEGYAGEQSCLADCSGWGDCVPTESCGDGIVNNSEECDGQAGVPEHYTCTPSCTLEYVPYCGDNQVNQPSELCDGNSEDCTTQTGYDGTRGCLGDCTWGDCNTSQYCGDGTKNGPEICDDGANNGTYGYCNSDCTGETPAVCGNSIKEGSEECDGQAGVPDHYICTAQCTLEYVPYCGDHIVNGQELCDGNSQSCQKNGYNGSQLCNATCDGWEDCNTSEWCGDNIINDSEECDGDTPRLCTTQEGYSGVESCSGCIWGQCETSQSCGDGLVNGNEVCDTTGEICQVGGYNGIRACLPDCSGYDECTPTESCGDGIINDSELCDGNSQACKKDGYNGSQLCNVTCDGWGECNTSEYCGDNIINDAEECDITTPQACTTGDGYNGWQYCTNCSWGDCQASESCGDGIMNGPEQCDGADGVIPGFSCSDLCILQYNPQCLGPGEVVINEIMPDPVTPLLNGNGEWFEVYNTTGYEVNLRECVIKDNDTDSHTIESDLKVASHGYAVLARNGDPLLNGGITADYVYSGFVLANNTDDEVIIECCSLQTDKVEYGQNGWWPYQAGKSIILKDTSFDNNVGTNWCLSSSTYYTNNKGTPGTANDQCQPICGNGLVESGEDCDANSQSCTTQDGYAGTQSCSGSCSWNSCQANEFCGDQVKNGLEECDGADGVIEHHSCSADCSLEYVPYCGDHIVNGQELCDGNSQSCQKNGYNGSQLCNATCDGWEECNTTEYCGDNIINDSEECDGDAPKSCTTQEGYSGMQSCSGCIWGQCQTNESCGDGQLNGNEICDGGSQSCQINGYNGNQSCKQDCSGWETCVPYEYCGDGIINDDEVCDGGSQSCQVGGYNGNQSCMQDCSGWNNCQTYEYCGDGIKNNNEECDGTDGITEHYQCNQECQLEYVPYCGDEQVNQPFEQCDGNVPEACQTQNGYLGSQMCLDSCLWSLCTSSDFCGDGVKNGPEVCDDGQYNGQPNKCNSDCTGKTSAVCGNNIREDPEECDGEDGTLPHYTCSQQCSLEYVPYCGDNQVNQTSEQCDDGNANNNDGCSSGCQTEYGSLKVCKYRDADNDLNTTADQTPVLDWTFTVSLGQYSNSQKTQSDGCRIFSNLEPGTYNITEDLVSGWIFLDPGTGTTTAQVSYNVQTEKLFYNYESGNFGSICGYKFEDPDGNNQTANTLALKDWTINLSSPTTCQTNDEWADQVMSYNQGTRQDGSALLPEVTNSSLSLGQAQSNDTLNYVSLGFGGTLILKFNNLIINGSGSDIEIIETSYTSPDCASHPEKVQVYASQTGLDGSWLLLGTGCLDSAFDLQSLVWAQYIKLVDATNPADFTAESDGYDVDGVKALHCGAGWQQTATTLTDNNGRYCFQGLTSGLYRVSEVLKDSWYNTSSTYNDMILSAPETIENNFSNTKYGKISGYEYEDKDNNASTTADWLALSGWTINLFGNQSTTTPIATTTSSASGYFEFTQLKPDNYSLSQVMPNADWINLVSPQSTIPILSGDTKVDNNFVNYYKTSQDAAVCGNNKVESGEECDDGNTVGGDGCNNTCHTEGSGGGDGGGGGGGAVILILGPGGTTLPPIEPPLVLGDTAAPLLVITKTINKLFANPGEKGIEYNIKIVNNGNLTAYNAIASDKLPSGFFYGGSEETAKSWLLGDIAPNETRTIPYTIDIDQAIKVGPYTNTAEVKADNHDPIAASANLEIREVSVLGEELAPTGFEIRELIILVVVLMGLASSVIIFKKRYQV